MKRARESDAAVFKNIRITFKGFPYTETSPPGESLGKGQALYLLVKRLPVSAEGIKPFFLIEPLRFSYKDAIAMVGITSRADDLAKAHMSKTCKDASDALKIPGTKWTRTEPRLQRQ